MISQLAPLPAGRLDAPLFPAEPRPTPIARIGWTAAERAAAERFLRTLDRLTAEMSDNATESEAA